MYVLVLPLESLSVCGLSIDSQAESNPHVKELIAQHVPVLEDFVLKILKLLKETIDKVPFGIRWLCKATWSLVHEKFPDTQPDTLNALIGGFFFLRYINPIIATPHGMWVWVWVWPQL